MYLNESKSKELSHLGLKTQLPDKGALSGALGSCTRPEGMLGLHAVPCWLRSASGVEMRGYQSRESAIPCPLLRNYRDREENNNAVRRNACDMRQYVLNQIDAEN